MPIAKIPHDCWADVLHCLSFRDLVSVSKASRGTHTSTVPFLYRYISWDWHVNLVSSQVDNSGDIWEPPTIPYDWEDASPHFQDVLQYASNIVQEARFPSSARWIDALEQGDVYAYAAILLSQTPNLRSLRLDYSFVWQSGFPGLMLKHALFTAPKDTLSQFERLESVDYGSNVRASENADIGYYVDYNEEGFPDCEPEQFMAWFYLPPLRSLAVWLRSAEGIESHSQHGKYCNLANLHTLVLARSTVGYKPIWYLLSHACSLKSLHVGLAYKCFEDFPVFKGAEALLQGLHSVSNTLENLSISMDLRPDGITFWSWYEEDHVLQSMFRGFLRQFSNLRSAEVLASLLLGWWKDDAQNLHDVLPATLWKLCLRVDLTLVPNFEMDEGEVLNRIQHLLPHYKSATPSIHHIVVRLWEDFNLYLEKRAETQAICKSEGIGLSTSCNHFPPGLWTGTTESDNPGLFEE